ncbi:MAG: hypothetical protein NC548_15830 [Lachnospiraceae bacterium]|nr:hypothetical protein [Lachnospiraceae bacterium]
MTIMEMEAEIKKLDDVVVLSNCAEERLLALEKIDKLKKAIVEAKNTTKPVIIPIKDAPTIGTAKEQRLKKGKMGVSAMLLGEGRAVL